MRRRILVTGALPYANSALHLGHMVEYFQVDIWARFQRMRGHECYALCADDTHGTPVMIAAQSKGIRPEEHIANTWKSHVQDFQDFQIYFDHYSSTHSEENRKLCEEFYAKMKDKGFLRTALIQQLYCVHDKMFLPDRLVKGQCPNCGTKDQYGDNCEKCSAAYAAEDLVSPYCTLCGNSPAPKNSEHIFFCLNEFREFLEEWLPLHTSKEIHNKMKEWFNEPLRDWDISRDAPYFGFLIPGHRDKFFYVWVDAPMGYVSTTLQFCRQKGLSFQDFWGPEEKSEKEKDSNNMYTEVYHIIGKDILYFHTLFWPALLKTADLRRPNQVWAHGHLTFNGEKMSKSKGTQILARTYLENLDPLYLRYYFATKMGAGMDDLDFSPQDFTHRVNSEFIGKITNLGSRSAQLLHKKWGGQLGSLDSQGPGEKLLQDFQARSDDIAAFYEGREFQKVTMEIRHWADVFNRYFDEAAPWKKLDSDPEGARSVLTTTLCAFRLLTVFLNPILPSYALKVAHLFGEGKKPKEVQSQESLETLEEEGGRIPNAYTWEDIRWRPSPQQTLQKYEPLAVRPAPEALEKVWSPSPSKSG